MSEQLSPPNIEIEALLAGITYESNVPWRDGGTELGVRFDELTVPDIVRVVRSVYDAHRLPAELRDDATQRVAAYNDAVSSAFIELPNQDPLKAMWVYGILAGADDRPQDRDYVASYVNCLAKPKDSHDFAVSLWEALIQDDNPSVREAAAEVLTQDLDGEDAAATEESFVRDGLNWSEAMSLVGKYIQALRHAAGYVGPTVLTETVAPPSPAPES